MNPNKAGNLAATHGRSAILMLALCASAAGCSAEAGVGGEETAAKSQELSWKTWGGWGGIGPTTQYFGPAVCSNRSQEYILVSHRLGSPNNLGYQVRANIRSKGLNANWDQVPTRQLSSPPTCAFLFPKIGSSTRNFLLAGRSSSGIYTITGLDKAQPADPVNPSFSGSSWQRVPGTPTFSSSSDGYPAVAANGGLVASNADLAVLTYVSGGKLYAHARALPYSQNTWAAPHTLDLPAGTWSVEDPPAITYMTGTKNKFTILVRLGTPNGNGLFYTYYNGSALESWGGPAFIPQYTLDSDVAVDWSQYTPGTFPDALTVYFRSGQDLIQTTVPEPGGIGMLPFNPVANGATPTFWSGPRVSTIGSPEGMRVVVAQGVLPGESETILRNHQSAAAPSPYPDEDW